LLFSFVFFFRSWGHWRGATHSSRTQHDTRHAGL
jgi:hypothetical protein